MKRVIAKAWLGLSWVVLIALVIGFLAMLVYWVILSPELQVVLLMASIVGIGALGFHVAGKMTNWSVEVLKEEK